MGAKVVLVLRRDCSTQEAIKVHMAQLIPGPTHIVVLFVVERLSFASGPAGLPNFPTNQPRPK